MVTKSELKQAYRLARIINHVESVGAFEWGKVSDLRPSVYIAQRVPSIPRVAAGALICHLAQPEERHSLQIKRQLAYDIHKGFFTSIYASHREAAPALFREACSGVWRLHGWLPTGKPISF